MLIAVWIVSGILALMYLFAGITKTFSPHEKLRTTMPWTDGATTLQVRIVGILEILGAVGLIVPALTGIAPILTPIAAVGLALIQVVAVGIHIRRGEAKALPLNIVLLAGAVFVEVARFAGV
jgi:uncharacterized membrane protein